MTNIHVPRKSQEDLQREMQEKLMIYQLLQQQIENLKQAAAMLERGVMEVEMSKDVLKDLSNVKEDNETFIPIGSGCYVKGRLSRPKSVLAEIGAGVVKEKSVEEVEKMLDEKLVEIRNQERAVAEEMSAVADRMKELLPDLQKIAKEAQE